MMFVPDVFNDRDYDLFDEVFDDNSFWPFGSARANGLMKTDVEEKDGKYIMKAELPGFAKGDITLSLKDGVLRIHAKHSGNNDEKDKKGNVIRQERYSGSVDRSFYVGKEVKESDIKASYNNGVLTVEVPEVKQVEAPKEENKYIEIQ